MSVAPNAGVVALDNFKEPTVSADGLQGQVPKPLAGQQDYVLTASGFVPGGSIPGLGTMASQDADNVAITGGAIDGTTVGTTTPEAGSFTTLIGGAGSANYGRLTGGATTKAVQFQTLGTDTNVALAIQTKGTGAIDLAAGSSGINISNGGTVTAVTRTVDGGNYSSFPTVTISPPTTAGGVQATASVPSMYILTPTIVSGGIGYTVGDVLAFVGGTPVTTAATFNVATVSSGVITSVTRNLTNGFNTYTVLPTNPVSVTGGTGTGATFNLNYGFSLVSLLTAGSGYVEQPTVTFSGGGGSGAAAYASVGGGTIIRSLGSTGTQSLDFYTPQGISSNVPALRLRDTVGDSFVQIAAASTYTNILAQGNANAVLKLGCNGTSRIEFNTNGGNETNQMRVAHTASAVNYVQVTGAATGNQPLITAQGSDANIILNIQSKGAANILFTANAAEQFRTGFTASAVNSLQANGASSGNSPSLQARGTGTDLDVILTPKGTGNVRFGTYTGTILTPTGYIEIKDSGGTTRRLLVG